MLGSGLRASRHRCGWSAEEEGWPHGRRCCGCPTGRSRQQRGSRLTLVRMVNIGTAGLIPRLRSAASMLATAGIGART